MFAHKSIKLVFAGSILSLVAVVLIVFGLLNKIPEVANQQAYLRSSRGVEAAIKNEEAKLAGVLLDNSRWSEAVLHGYGEIDREWLEKTWGRSTDQGNYNIVLVIDGNGNTLWSKTNTEQAPRNPLKSYTSTRMEGFMHALSREGKPNTVIDIFWNNGSLLILGGAPIISEDDSNPLPIQSVRYLVFAKFLDAETLTSIAHRVLISDLTLSMSASGDVERFETPLKSLSGDVVAYANWHDIRPGDIARNSVQFPTLIFLLCFSLKKPTKI
jgi:sensor domain CHASE-containing protein